MSDPTRLREEMVQRVLSTARPISEAVAGALLAVPRHRFLPDVSAQTAYHDDAIVTKRDASGLPISSSSQPTIMAIMLDQLAPRPGDRVLEIGAGTGYNAALIDHLVGPAGRVVTLDIDLDLVERARDHLSGTGVAVVQADGALGHPDGAPYDRIIATVGAWDLPPAWQEQLAPGGRIVLPLDLGGTQCSIAFERDGDRWVSRSVVACGFMRMRGSQAGPETHVTLDGDLKVMLPRGGDAPEALGDWLSSAVPFGFVEVDADCHLWLGLHSPRLCMLAAPASDPRLPDAPMVFNDVSLSYGLLSPDGIAFLGRSVMAGGPDGPALAEELIAQARAWDAAGRPVAADLRITVLPLSAPADGLVVDKRHHRLQVSWGSR
jgi:protein-L-isoaspartate(D-aspartate) O-methyltransferase